jgi:tyrosine-specific transport protein
MAGSVHVGNLLHSNWGAVPSTLGVLSLAFVFQNIVPVVCSRLEVRCTAPTTQE